jgi:tetratricopeptide (TPR) repeat protein
MTDFFISYTAVDQPWAEWIASVLEAANFTVTIQAWDFRPGGNFVVEMQNAAAGSDRTIAVLSPDYPLSRYAMAEWAAAFVSDPDGSKGKLVPVLVREMAPTGLLASIIYINLIGLHEAEAREKLLGGLARGRVMPEVVRFPGAHLFPGPAPAPPDPVAAQAALAALPIEEVPQPGPLPVDSRMPWAPNPLFVGREEDLKTLARQLKAGETSAVGQVEIAAATGLGGMGKTQLASEFAHRYGHFFAGGVFWMSFADADSVSVEVAACGQSLGLHLKFETLTLEQQVRLVEEAWQSPIPRLLVFDNCEEEELLHRWRPRFGGSRVLVTSRRSEWDAALGVKTVPLTTLPRPASIELLRRFRPDIPGTEPSLGGIAEELGDLPLALHLAGSFLKTYRSAPFAQPVAYLESLQKTDLLRHPSLEGRGAGILPTGHEGHVGRTFALSFERLDLNSDRDALAIALLARAAWFAPGEPIPRSLLLKTVQVNPEDLTTGLLVEDALRRLTDLGLMEINHRSDLLMHRLVAAWASALPGDEEPRVAVEEAVLVESEKLNKTDNPAFLLTWQPHLRALTDRAIKREDRTAARLCDELGIHLWQAGYYSEARPYLERSVALHLEISGAEHPNSANSINNLGRLLHSQGEYPAARSYYEQGLVIREKVLGTEHPDVARSLNNIAILLSDQRDYQRAGPYYERALKIREKVLGPEHSDTALSLASVGYLMMFFGRLIEAQSYLERALAILEKTLSPEHPYTASCLGNLGGVFRRQQSYDDARLCYERALAIDEKVLGTEHPGTANTLRNLGILLSDQGNFIEGRLYFERALTIREKVLGPEHPETSISLHDLGVLFFQQGNSARARWYLERALRNFNTRLNPNHPYIKEARRYLSMLPGARQQRKQHSKKK